MSEWTGGESDDRDKKALVINHLLNKHVSSQSEACEWGRCHIQIKRKKSKGAALRISFVIFIQSKS